MAAIERERRAECREIANQAVEAAREMDAHFAAAAKAAWLYQGYVMRLEQLDGFRLFLGDIRAQPTEAVSRD